MVTEYGVFVNGEWREARSRETLVIRNPANGKEIARFASGNREDVDQAVKAARKAFPEWKRTPGPRRAEVLLEAARLVRRRKQELGELVTTEMGKVLPEGLGDVQEAIDLYEYIAGEGRRMFGHTMPSELPNKWLMTMRQPLGVAGLITPWNFPIAIPAWKTGPALVAGNAVVLKPAEQTPTCAARLVEILTEAGIPPGVVNMVPGLGETAGDALVNHPQVDVISFTGGVETGRIVYQNAAKRLAACELELGGKNPQIVMDDADLDLALEGLLFGAFGTAGQRCTATSRLVLHKNVHDAFLKKLLARVERLKLGDPLLKGTDVGPLNSQEQLDKVLSYVAIGKKEGAKLLAGGERAKGNGLDKGFFVKPTVFEAKHGMRIAVEEIFGPVLSVITVRSYEEAIEVANGTQYGLSSSIYTTNVNTAFRAVNDLHAGLVYVNAPTIGAEVGVPFGGVKNTGNKGREAGPNALDEFSEPKSIVIEFSGRLQKAQIDTHKG